MSQKYGRTNAIWHKKKRIIYRYTVETLTHSQFSSACLFLISCMNISGWGNFWVQLSFEVVSCIFTFAFTAKMYVFLNSFFACLLLLPSLEAHIRWLLHAVSQEAIKSRVGYVRAFAGDLHACGLFFWFDSEKAWVKYCLAQYLWKRGPNRWSERQSGR